MAYTQQVFSDHVVQVPVGPGGTTIKVVDGDTVYYGDTFQTSSGINQGSLTSGQSATITDTPLLIRSASVSDVNVTVLPAAASAASGVAVSSATSGISATLSAPLVNATVLTSLPAAVTVAIPSGVAITILDPSGTMQLWQTSAPAVAGDTSISVNSATVAGSYASGSSVYAAPAVTVSTPNIDQRYRLNGGGVRFAATGASYSQGNGSPDSASGGNGHAGDGWFPKLCQLSNGRIIPIINNAIGGDTTKGVLSRIGMITAANVDYCVFDQFMRNEIAGGGWSLSAMMGRVDQIVKALRAAGVQPMFTSTLNALHAGGTEVNIMQGNRALAAYCAANGVFFVDASAVVADPANVGDFLAQYAGSPSGHPNEAGHMALAQAWWTAIQSVIPYGSFLLPTDDTDPWNLLPHGTFASMTGAGAPTGWSSTGAGTAAFSYAANTAVAGKALTITRLAANGTSGAKGITVSVAQGGSTFSPGDTVVWMGRLAAATLLTQGASFDSFVTMTGASAPNQIYQHKAMAVDWTSPSAWYQQSVVQPNTTALAASLVLNNGANTTADASVVLGQIGLYNLTKLGVAY